MHDPMHVVFSVRRPWSKGRPPMARHTGRSFGFWTRRDNTVVLANGEERRTPIRRRLHFHPAFFRLRGREWFLPSLVTVWHVDPETDGSDSSCSHAARDRRQQAIKRHQFIRAAVLDWYWRHYGWLHVHHWQIQLDVAQRWRRRLFTRCATCGGREERGRSVNFHVVVNPTVREKARSETSFRERWFTGEKNLHHHDCADLASIRALKIAMAASVFGPDEIALRIQAEREPYYGCYPWWREAILGEDTETAAALAAAHVQRSCHPCDACGGSGHKVTQEFATEFGGGVRPVTRVVGQPQYTICEPCEGSGHPRVEKPIPASAV